jgi:hypothetical protein
MARTLYPSLYQINTRVWLTELSRTLGKTATLDDIPDANLDHGFRLGLGSEVWHTGQAGQRISRVNSQSDERNFRRHCQTSVRKTSEAPVLPSLATLFMIDSEGMRLCSDCANGSTDVVYG